MIIQCNNLVNNKWLQSIDNSLDSKSPVVRILSKLSLTLAQSFYNKIENFHSTSKIYIYKHRLNKVKMIFDQEENFQNLVRSNFTNPIIKLILRNFERLEYGTCGSNNQAMTLTLLWEN
jgi:hypothetical protein